MLLHISPWDPSLFHAPRVGSREARWDCEDLRVSEKEETIPLGKMNQVKSPSEVASGLSIQGA